MGFTKKDPLTKRGPIPAAFQNPPEWFYFDIETSGLKEKEGDILSFGWVHGEDEGVLFNRDGKPNAESIRINGITSEILSMGLPEVEFYNAIIKVISDRDPMVVAGYNQDGFDGPFLRRKIGPAWQDLMCQRYGLDLMTVVFEPTVMGGFWPGKKRLVDMFAHFCGRPPKNAHGAIADCHMTCELATELWMLGHLDRAFGRDEDAVKRALKVLDNQDALRTWAGVERAMAILKTAGAGQRGSWVTTEKTSIAHRTNIPKDFPVPESWKTTYERTERKLLLLPDSTTCGDCEEGDDE